VVVTGQTVVAVMTLEVLEPLVVQHVVDKIVDVVYCVTAAVVVVTGQTVVAVMTLVVLDPTGQSVTQAGHLVIVYSVVE